MWSRSLAAAVLVCSAGCASDAPDPFGFLHVQVVGEVPTLAGELRAVVVWHDHTDERGVFTADDAPVDPHAPFEFALTARPRAQADANVTPIDGPVARGSLLAYVDRDRSGHFSWTEADSGGFRDFVVGWVPGVRIRYASAPTPESSYLRGFLLEVSTRDEEGELVTEDTLFELPLNLHLFGLDSTACMGLSPPVLSMPADLATAVSAVKPEPGILSPYSYASPPCPGDRLPNDWWRIDCDSEPGQYLVSSLQWPAADAVSTQCGWTRRHCELRLPAGVEPGPEYPSCDW